MTILRTTLGSNPYKKSIYLHYLWLRRFTFSINFDAIDAGADLTGTVDGVEYDIDGQVRAGLWDIGADELLGGHIKRLLLGIG